jgi:hypothetical protein
MMDAPEKNEKKERVKPATGLKTLPKMTSKPHVHRYEMHNEKFAKENMEFQTACDKAGVKPTVRQASKWRNKKGRAYVQGR